MAAFFSAMLPQARAAGEFDAGTLAYHLSTNAVAHARGYADYAEAITELSGWGYAVYTNENLARLTNAVWSTNFWLHGVRGLSATDIGCSNGMGGQGLFTMVSPRHYLFATHMHPEGYLAAFLGTNNVIYWRKTLERVDVSNDVSVGILNADLPPEVGFLPVAPANLLNYLPADNLSVIQGVGMNQDMKLFSQPMNFGNRTYVRWDNQREIPLGLKSNWSIRIRAGDSSNPEMLLIDDQLVLVSHNFGAQAGPNYAMFIPAINEKMHYLSKHNHVKSDYQLTEFSLRKWPKLPE
jgi:hypothetical protein